MSCTLSRWLAGKYIRVAPSWDSRPSLHPDRSKQLACCAASHAHVLIPREARVYLSWATSWWISTYSCPPYKASQSSGRVKHVKTYVWACTILDLSLGRLRLECGYRGGCTAKRVAELNGTSAVQNHLDSRRPLTGQVPSRLDMHFKDYTTNIIIYIIW